MPMPASFFCLTSLWYIVTNHPNVLKFSAPLDTTSSQNLSYADSYSISYVNRHEESARMNVVWIYLPWTIIMNKLDLSVASLSASLSHICLHWSLRSRQSLPCRIKDKISLFSHSHYDWVSGRDHLRAPGLGCKRIPLHTLSMNTEGGNPAELSLANGQSRSLRWFVIQQHIPEAHSSTLPLSQTHLWFAESSLCLCIEQETENQHPLTQPLNKLHNKEFSSASLSSHWNCAFSLRIFLPSYMLPQYHTI